MLIQTLERESFQKKYHNLKFEWRKERKNIENTPRTPGTTPLLNRSHRGGNRAAYGHNPSGGSPEGDILK